MSSEEVENNSWANMYLRGTLIIVVGFLSSIIVLFSGWLGWFNSFSDRPEIWFQRSGSMMTVILLVTDYYVYKLITDLGRINMIPQFARKTKDSYRPYIKWCLYVAVALTVFATFIWGYGDIAYLELR